VVFDQLSKPEYIFFVFFEIPYCRMSREPHEAVTIRMERACDVRVRPDDVRQCLQGGNAGGEPARDFLLDVRDRGEDRVGRARLGIREQRRQCERLGRLVRRVAREQFGHFGRCALGCPSGVIVARCTSLC
jgi:hypothetical protein